MFVYYKCYIIIELMYLKELMLIRQANQECDICHYWYLLDKGFKFQPHVCNGCHDLLLMSMNLSDIAILNIQGTDCCCVTIQISKSEAINLMQNIDLTKKSETR